MTAYIRNPLTYVWAVLVAITIASWWIGRGGDMPFQVNPAVTIGVLLMAALKAQLVIQYFMEVRIGPIWLKWSMYGWVVLVLLLLLVFYWTGI